MAVRWEYPIGHYFRERFAPRRLFKLVGYNGPLACLQEIDVNGQPVTVEIGPGVLKQVPAQQIPVQGLETVIEPIKGEQFDVIRVLYGSGKTSDGSKKIEEPEYDEWEKEWTIKRN